MGGCIYAKWIDIPEKKGRGSVAYILELISSMHSPVPCLATLSPAPTKTEQKTVNMSIFQENQ
jgi:hypothetical protein